MCCVQEVISCVDLILQTQWPSFGSLTESTSLTARHYHGLPSAEFKFLLMSFRALHALFCSVFCSSVLVSCHAQVLIISKPLKFHWSGIVRLLFLTYYSLCINSSYPVTLWLRDRSSKNELLSVLPMYFLYLVLKLFRFLSSTWQNFKHLW